MTATLTILGHFGKWQNRAIGMAKLVAKTNFGLKCIYLNNMDGYTDIWLYAI